jgi:hypothetical protein
LGTVLRLGAVYSSRIKGNYEGLTSINSGDYPGEMVPWNFTLAKTCGLAGQAGQAGWAQINGRDDIPIPKKVEYDEYYLNHRALFFDLKILFLTFLKVTRAENVSH